jgi:dolichol-phosphate mannosyltransferase
VTLLPAPVGVEDAVVVIPTYNERENIGKLLATLLELYPGIRVLVVDDSSPDGTAAVVREAQSRSGNVLLLERTSNRGFASSYRDGFHKVLTEYPCRAIVTMDADFSHSPAEIGKMLNRLSLCDAVVGSRYTAGGSVRNWNLRRRTLSRAANFYVRAVLGFEVRDTTSGFNCIRREALEKAGAEQTSSEGYSFLVELKYLLVRQGSRIVEHPIAFDERREGQSKMSAGKIWEAFWMPWRIRFRS